MGYLYLFLLLYHLFAFSALTLLVGHPACKKLEWWGAGMVICLERDADLHMAQLMPLPLTVSCFSIIQIGFTFLVLAHPGSPGQRTVKWVCVHVSVCVSFSSLFYRTTWVSRYKKDKTSLDLNKATDIIRSIQRLSYRCWHLPT